MWKIYSLTPINVGGLGLKSLNTSPPCPTLWCETKILPHPHPTTFAGQKKPVRGETERDGAKLPFLIFGKDKCPFHTKKFFKKSYVIFTFIPMLHLFQWKTLCIYAFGNIIKKKKKKKRLWVLVRSIGKISNGWIRDLGFNLCLHQKPIGVLVWW